MKHIPTTLAAFAMLGLFSLAQAGAPDSGASVLVRQTNTVVPTAKRGAPIPMPPAPGFVEPSPTVPLDPMPEALSSAPAIDPSVTATVIDPPIIVGAVADHPPPDEKPVNQKQVHNHHAKKKQNLFQKWMEMERKKNAWLKRKFSRK